MVNEYIADLKINNPDIMSLEDLTTEEISNIVKEIVDFNQKKDTKYLK
jgi:hypothetical protein